MNVDELCAQYTAGIQQATNIVTYVPARTEGLDSSEDIAALA